MGWRGRGGRWIGGWPGRGAFSFLTTLRRPWWPYGYGLGYGYGRGFSYGYGGPPYYPRVYQRHPWLPPWWWTQSGGYTGYSYPFRAYPGYLPASYPATW